MDLTQRLREMAESAPNTVERAAHITNEAADRIEQLEAALRGLHNGIIAGVEMGVLPREMLASRAMRDSRRALGDGEKG